LIFLILESNPNCGFQYLFLEEEDYLELNKNPDSPTVHALKIEHCGSIRYRLESVVGQMHGLGVENLQGSGLIAAETSKAYQEIFTITLVTCRSVGIGAYLVRLGQRTVQVQGAPIILTGAAALNKVYGRKVYSSNLQLGGTHIMHGNGISHLVVPNDLEGVVEIIKWLSFGTIIFTLVPKHRNGPLPILTTNDPIDRIIDVDIPKSSYDPRILLQGTEENGVWNSGFFDKGYELMSILGHLKRHSQNGRRV
jgi:acetyl-CoA carboxylase/biotin carboxylase 1